MLFLFLQKVFLNILLMTPAILLQLLKNISLNLSLLTITIITLLQHIEVFKVSYFPDTKLKTIPEII